MGPWRLQLPCIALLTISSAVSAFYLPGVAPTSYKKGQQVPLNVNRLTPGEVATDHQLHSVFSFDYYHPAFKFCKPEGEPKYVSESLGSILFGDRIMSSPYDLKMLEDNGVCKALCEKQEFNDKSARFVNARILDFYNLNWLVDGLPAGIPWTDGSTNTSYFQRGFPLGSLDEQGTAYLHNHYDINIDYHEAGKDKYRVVGVRVYPSSRADNQDLGGGKGNCGNRDTSPPLALSETANTDVTWTYAVYWEPSTTAWATRWDPFLHVFSPSIHWFSLVNSAVIVMFLVAMVAAILMRALKKDFARYQRLESFNLDDLSGADGNAEDGVQEDSGWKLVHGDVFRTPRNPLMLSVFLGNGSQLFVITATTIAFALFGFLSPSNRGSLGTVMLLLWTIFSFIGGYVSARVYKTFGGEAWKKNIALTPTLIPGIVFSMFFLLNLFLWAKSSSGAVPFTTMLVILGIWFVISLPLSFAGSWIGFKHSPVTPPVRVNQIPRQIPPAPTYLRPLPSMALVGVLPFGAIFVELYFVLNNIWFGKVYYMFGFLFLCYGIMIITCAAVTMLLVYFLLCAENYHWQWRAFLTAGASAGYVFINALLYWVSKLSFGSFTGAVLYLGYSALLSFLFFILTGEFEGPSASSRAGLLSTEYTGPLKLTEGLNSSIDPTITGRIAHHKLVSKTSPPLIKELQQKPLLATGAEAMSLPDLLSTLTESLKSASPSIPDATSLTSPPDGISLLDTKNQLLLSYLQNLVFLIILKLQNLKSRSEMAFVDPHSDEEVVKELVSLRVYLERGVRPLESRLKYQLDKLLLAANDAGSQSEIKPNGASKQDLRPATKTDPDRSSTSPSPNASPLLPATTHVADLSHRPNPSAFISLPTRATSPSSRSTSVYRPPQINPTLPPTSAKPQRKPRTSHTLNEYVREELDDMPLAQPSIGAGSGLSGKAAEREAERRGYEEDRLLRLPEQGKKGKRRREMGEGFGEDLLRGGAGYLDDLVKGGKKQKKVGGGERTVGEAWEKRVKRGLGRKRR